MAYEIAFTITALCPCCGKELPSNHYLTESRSTGHPIERDNPYERKDRRVFITPCANCFEHKSSLILEAPAMLEVLRHAQEQTDPHSVLGVRLAEVIAKATGGAS